MNALLRPEVLIRPHPSPQPHWPLAAHAVLRHVWESRFGTIVIEVRGQHIFVNGSRVEPADGHTPAGGRP